MKPWIVLACIYLAPDAFRILLAFFTLNPVSIIGSIAVIGLQVHYIAVVCSHKKEVEAEQSGVEIVAMENV